MIDFIISYFHPLKEFASFPRNVKNGIISLFSAWIYFFSLNLFHLFPAGGLTSRQLIAGAMACGCILTLRNWARVLSALCNLMVIVQLLPVSIALFQSGNLKLGWATGVSVFLFGLSDYFLFLPETAAFFKRFSVSNVPENPDPK